MEIITAKTAGFCFGVKRAVERAYELVDTEEKLYTYGPIIHNDTVVNDLKDKGVGVLDGEDELRRVNDGTVVIRAHGVPKHTTDLMDSLGINYVDETCPFVKRIHEIVKERSENGYNIAVIGNAGHPEVLGILGWVSPKVKEPPIVIETKEEAMGINLDRKVPLCIVSQTTFKENLFQELVEIIETREYNVYVVNTICNATKERQKEAKDIASRVDAMIVIGGRHSSNAQKLYDICKNECEHTCFIETVDDLRSEIPVTASLVGITAGASTPNKIIEEVQNYVRINF